MPDTPHPMPESAQERAWRRANPILASLATAQILETRALQRAALRDLERERQREATIRAWVRDQADERSSYKASST